MERIGQVSIGETLWVENVSGKNPLGVQQGQGMSIAFNGVKKAASELRKCRKNGGFVQQLQEEEGRKNYLFPSFPIPCCSLRAKPFRKCWEGEKTAVMCWETGELEQTAGKWE